MGCGPTLLRRSVWRNVATLIFGTWLFVWISRLPQFDFVAVRIVYPGEAAVALVSALRVDLDAFFRQAVEQCIEVVDDVVQHERGWAGLEVFGVGGENAPDRHLLTFRIIFFTPRQSDTMAAIREAEMFCVPFLHLLLIRGLEEDTTDAEDSALLAHGCFPFLRFTRAMPLRMQSCS